jgi:ribonuclease R
VLIEVRPGEGIRPPAKGDRVLAKIEATPGQDYHFRARIIRGLSDRSKRVLGFIAGERARARLIPVDKKARNELRVRVE